MSINNSPINTHCALLVTDQLPITPYLQQIRESLIAGNVVLSAAPGAGKSTVLLLDLLKYYPSESKTILVLQPRRVIVRALAQYLSDQIGEPVGHSIGYRMRGEAKVSSNTKLTFVTEAILTRRLQADPELSDVALIVFDEFHERNVHSDFGLALALESQNGLREDLRLLVMSATLDMQSLMALMPEAEHQVVEGRQFPISYDYRPLPATAALRRSNSRPHRNAMEVFIARIALEALTSHSNDVLVFVPSIKSVQLTCDLVLNALEEQSAITHIDVLPLYGALGRAEQQRAIAVAPKSRRKVVVATNIAETSLTIEGIGVVIDSGLERRIEIDLRTGIEGLVTKSISQASAYQRAGRAGRLAAGYCYRLWSQESHSRLAEQSPPEITQRDVSDLVLHAIAWGSHLSELPLLTKPSNAQLLGATQQLTWLGALDREGAITYHGRQLLQYASSLRLAHMQVMIAERFPGSDSWSHAAIGIAVFLESYHGKSNQEAASAFAQWLVTLDRLTYLRIEKGLQRQAVRAHKQTLKAISEQQIATCLATANPDWVGFHLGQGKYKLANGKQATLETDSAVGAPQWLGIGGLKRKDNGIIQITLCQPIDEALVEALIAPLFTTDESLVWSDSKERFQSFEQKRLGEIVIQQKPLPFSLSGKGNNERLKLGWTNLLRKKGFSWLPIPDNALSFLHRCRIAMCLCQRTELIPLADFSEDALMNSLDKWLTPYLDSAKSLNELKGLNWQALLSNRLEWEQSRWIEEQLPSHFELPTGDKVRLDYSNIVVSDDGMGKGPIAATRMQLLFGLHDSPMLADKQLPITFELLSPALRPLQTTSDLASFWQSESYKAIKKEMKGRYPKHLWPDDPANTAPTKRTKKYSN